MIGSAIRTRRGSGGAAVLCCVLLVLPILCALGFCAPLNGTPRPTQAAPAHRLTATALSVPVESAWSSDRDGDGHECHGELSGAEYALLPGPSPHDAPGTPYVARPATAPAGDGAIRGPPRPGTPAVDLYRLQIQRT
ncbi:hypothetical protein ACZ90_19120 [Streptomyces albus subsp. albus]|nr:hypothetical protein ACZ90_19120 [Streptomyces albus subsp. albus]